MGDKMSWLEFVVLKVLSMIILGVVLVKCQGSIPDPFIHGYLALEICDGIDNDSNGQIDEGLMVYSWYRDRDSDTYGHMYQVTRACSQPPMYVSNDWDCNDSNSTINPSADEIAMNGVDDDCDGAIDELECD